MIAALAFALTPWLSLGLLTPVSFGVAAVLRRSWWLAAATTVFTAGLFTILVLGSSEEGSTADTVFSVAMATNLVLGGVLAAVLSPVVARGRGSRSPLPQDQVDVLDQVSAAKREALTSDPALQLAIDRQERRRLAMEIVERDPGLADELHIGRPDLGGEFDDGGLVDVNRVPAEVLAALPGFTAAMAERVVSARNRHWPLTSGADLVVYADVPNDVVATASERLLFRDRTAEQAGDHLG